MNKQAKTLFKWELGMFVKASELNEVKESVR